MIKITEDALAELIASGYEKGFECARGTLNALNPTEFFTKEDVMKIIKASLTPNQND